jgi:stearoyl-CoA desaturase (delta-9 desaturase)
MVEAVVVFLIAYFVNISIITVLYHRGLAHSAVKLTGVGTFFTKNIAIWLTGIDPKGWVCMHRLHHVHSDTALDPHSPVNSSILGVFVDQHRAFTRVLVGLIKQRPEYSKVVSDIDFDVHWLNKKNLWLLPLTIHTSIGILLGFFTGNGWLGFGYVAGMSSHPIQGWMVNSFGHSIGYSNFDVGDQSRNNTFVAWTVAGEGYQNNHHRFPSSPKFSVKWFEFDSGFLAARLLQVMGIVTLDLSKIRELQPELAVKPSARMASRVQ